MKDQAQEEETRRMRERLEAITYAVECATNEEGTTCEQDKLLFAAGFTDELKDTDHSRSTVYLGRDENGGAVVTGPVDYLMRMKKAGCTRTIFDGLGTCMVLLPTPQQEVDYLLQQELPGNHMHFLPDWAQDAVRSAFTKRLHD